MLNLDTVIPNPQFRMCHSHVIAAPLADIWDELNTVPMSALPLGLVFESLRLLPATLISQRHPRLAGRTFLDITPIPVLFREAPHVVISAGLSQAWRLLGGSTPPLLDAAGLREWTGTGWLKVGMEFRLESTPKGNLLSTETRIQAMDPQTLRAFTAYWFVIRPFSGVIRREVLSVIAHRAETRERPR
ncbi:hypothetical protein KSF_076260 [Reticulibacter mediterranei]|uniref:DUF2867 domain-containing protein n=1 Tax=Reticulibacter mediterranei TaxID=2778369 RepID=A0A8J3IP44_9CHLR|nr:hypothetical protein [Reticulibacter mediterranei]GHO97578.1 hypothetical protein KSF_076260 [Reticulibacter mediterranei]